MSREQLGSIWRLTRPIHRYAELLEEWQMGRPHDVCIGGRWQESYAELHSQMLALEREPKLLEYACIRGHHPCGGLADRCVSLPRLEPPRLSCAELEPRRRRADLPLCSPGCLALLPFSFTPSSPTEPFPSPPKAPLSTLSLTPRGSSTGLNASGRTRPHRTLCTTTRL